MSTYIKSGWGGGTISILCATIRLASDREDINTIPSCYNDSYAVNRRVKTAYLLYSGSGLQTGLQVLNLVDWL